MARTVDERRKQGDKFCSTCEWFNWMDDDRKAISGYCRRYPPVIEVENSAADGFPHVRLTDWCGEYSKRQKTTA